ncbi:MAG: FAD-dependent monooxygenase, partial [Acidobacteriota bacterium]
MTRDLIVIGAGPAGLATAIAAARHGVRTLVVEKRSLPIDKACGEGLLPNGVEALARLGLASSALVRSSAPIQGIRYITASGSIASSTFPMGTGLGMRRACLSEALVARAREEPTLEIRSGVLAEMQWSRHGPRVTVGGTTWQPRLVIGADGLHSRVRSAAGIETKHGRRRRWGMRQHFSGAAWTDYVEVYFGRRFEAYVTPVTDGVNVAWLWDQDAIFDGGTRGRGDEGTRGRGDEGTGGGGFERSKGESDGPWPP